MMAAHQFSSPRISRTFRSILPAVISFSLLGCGKKEKTQEEPSSSKVEKSSEAPAPKLGSQMDELTFPKLPDMPVPKEVPLTAEKVALGEKLFFDKRLSVDGSVACYSCHLDENGSGGKDPLAIGAKSKQLTRHSPVLWNAGHLSKFYWDGRADSLEAQALGAWGGGNMGVGNENLDKKAAEIAGLPEYKAEFKKVFPDAKSIKAEHVAQAISSFERTLECKDTAYDRYAAGDKSALSDDQKTGLELFMGKAMCTACHSPPFFSSAYSKTSAFFNVGVGIKDVPEDKVDIGRMKVSEDEKDWASFKVPSLRNISRTAPYFHDGSSATLKEAVTFMASGGHDNKNKNPLMSDKKLSAEEIESLITFLEALDCEGKIKRDEIAFDK